MSEEKQETISDIVAEMRNGPCNWLTPEGIPQHFHDNELFSAFADRIEAAHGRTTIALRNIGAVNARLHAALKNAIEVLDAVGPLVLTHDDSCILTQGVSDAVNMAKRALNESGVAR